MKNVLLTGATGFLGSHLLEELLKKDITVFCTARSKEKAQKLEQLGVNTVFADLQKPETLRGITKDKDTVIHLTAIYDLKASWDLLYATNVLGTNYLATDALKYGVEHFVYTSTIAAMGPSRNPPANESTELNPIQEYGKSKMISEKNLLELYDKEGFPVTILRPTLIYGPRDMYSTYSILKAVKKGRFKKLPGKADKHFHMTFVKDVVDGYLRAIEKPNVSIGKTYILSSDEVLTYKEIFATISELLNVPKPEGTMSPRLAKLALWMFQKINSLHGVRDFMMRPEAVDEMKYDWIYSNKKAKKELGYQPKYTLRKGMKVSIEWFQNHGLL